MTASRILAAIASIPLTLLANLYLIFGTLFMALAALVANRLPGGRQSFGAFARIWSAGWLVCGGVRVSASVAQSLDGDDRYVYMANHASLFDIPALLITLPTPARFLAKRSLFKIPIFGAVLKVGGFVDIDREDLSRARQSFSESLQRMDLGYSLLVFPEGTRSADGRLLGFKRGGFLLALKTGRPIVPVGIRGSAAVQAKGSLRVRPGRIEIRYGRPIAVDEYGVRRRRELMAEVRERIAELAGVEPGGG